LNYFCKSLWAIFVKDVVIEFRSKQVLPTMVVLGMLIVWVMRIVSESVSAGAAVMSPAVLWIAFLFSGLLTQERSFAVEEHEDCMSGLLLLGGRWIEFIMVLLLGNIGISSVGTLFSVVVGLTRTPGSLLSIIVLVILMPMMIPAVFALLQLMGYMIAFDAVFVAACWLLFGFIIKE